MRKRTLLMVLLLLIGGAVINVAVAWGCAVKPIDIGFNSDFQQLVNPLPTLESDTRWMQKHGWSNDAVYRFWVQRFGNGVDQRTMFMHHPSRQGWWAFRAFYGLPFRSMEGAIQRNGYWTPEQLPEMEWEAVDATVVMVNAYSTVVPGAIYAPQKRPLPFCPIWPGFAINTIFYAAILWLLFAAPGFMRRRIRIKRGQCPACAYPVGTSEVCTECGAAVRSVDQ